MSSICLWSETQEPLSSGTLLANVCLLRRRSIDLVLVGLGDQYKSFKLGPCDHAPGHPRLASCPKSESNTEISTGLAQRNCVGELDAGSMYRACDALRPPKMPKKTSEAAEDALPTKRPRVETTDGLSMASLSFEEQLGAHVWPLRTDHTGKISMASAVQ